MYDVNMFLCQKRKMGNEKCIHRICNNMSTMEVYSFFEGGLIKEVMKGTQVDLLILRRPFLLS